MGFTIEYNSERLSFSTSFLLVLFYFQCSDFQKRYPNTRKTYFYKKTRVEKYAPYSMKDGIVLKVSEFADYDCKSLFCFSSSILFFPVKELIYVTQRYEHRHDKLEVREHDVRTNTVYEHYLPGRNDHLKGSTLINC